MKEIVIKVLKKALKEKKIDLKDEEIEKFISIPPSYEMGDFAFPCFFPAGKLKQNPNQFAIELRADIGNPTKEFQDIQTAGPYINFFLNRKKLAQDLTKQIIKQKDNFGKTDIGKGATILIEHTSINPNASPHVGRARNALIGDSIVKISKFLNFKPEVHYFVNDVSKQIAMLVLADAQKLKFEEILKAYIKIAAKVKKSKKLEQEVFQLLNKFENKDPETTKKFSRLVKTAVKGQMKILKDLGINYDLVDYESKYLSQTKGILSELKKSKKLFIDEDKRQVLDLKATPVERKMKSPVLVLTRNDGTGLYPLRDIAYTIEKMHISKNNIIVLGEDQKLYFEQLTEALKLLNKPSPKVVHYSFILLATKGKSKKMSTRKGDVILLKDFLDDAMEKAKREIKKRKTRGNAKKVGVGAVKYAILKNNNNKMIHFNLEDALNFEGDTGPYIQYSYARASSIIKKAKKPKAIFALRELEKKEIELVMKLDKFPEVVLNSYKNMNPSLIANYSYQLAQIFNEFYHACPVIGNVNQNFRLKLVESFRIVLKNSLNLLGIDVLDQM